MSDARRSAPHVARNAAPIADVLRGILPDEGLVLEIASGTGEHVIYFAEQFPNLAWRASDRDPGAIASIKAWQEEALQAKPWLSLTEPQLLDAASNDWPIGHCDAILCINMVHISPWEATQGLMRGARYYLVPGAPLYLYGAYRRDGVPTAPSNEAFDGWLKSRDSRFGVRRLEDVVAEAERNGLGLDAVIEMPANNLSVVFRRG